MKKAKIIKEIEVIKEVHAPFTPKKSFTVKAKIRSITKFIPNPTLVLFLILFSVGCNYNTVSKNGTRTMVVYYDVIPDAQAVELRYSFDAKNWYVDTVLLSKDTSIERTLKPFNQLRVILTDKDYYSRIIYLK